MKNIGQDLKAKFVQCTINCWQGKLGTIDTSFLEEVHNYKINNSEGFTAIMNHNGKKIGVFVHMGSNDSADWKTNFTTALVDKMRDIGHPDNSLVIPYNNKDSNIRMHKGFVDMYKTNTRDISRTFVKKCLDRGFDVAVTGHSLGGAQTTVNYIDWHYMLTNELGASNSDMERITGYAAASPAVGNREFVNSFKKRADGNFYTEFVAGDPIPEIPPWQMGYSAFDDCRAYSDFGNTLSLIPVHVLFYLTLGFLPSLAAWNHHPLRLLYGVNGKSMPAVGIP